MRVDHPARQAAVDDSRLAELAQMYVRGELTRAEWESARQVVQEGARRAQDAANLGVTRIPVHGLGETRDGGQGDGGWARLVVIDKILVSPARRRGGRFDPERVEIVWRA